MTADVSAARQWLDQLDRQPTDPYEHASWLALRQEAVPRLTSALRAVLDLADDLADRAARLDRQRNHYDAGRADSLWQAADRIRAAVAAAPARRGPMPDLRCPYCGAPLTIEMETRGRPYLTYEAVESIACADYRCGAEWEDDGTERTPGRASAEAVTR